MVQCNYLVVEVFSPEVLLEKAVWKKWLANAQSQRRTCNFGNT
jgi:hypothetical protein